ncbi:MAG: hypothetical protein AB1476_04495 [Candidatus Hadarchaeota archaeon]
MVAIPFKLPAAKSHSAIKPVTLAQFWRKMGNLMFGMWIVAVLASAGIYYIGATSPGLWGEARMRDGILGIFSSIIMLYLGFYFRKKAKTDRFNYHVFGNELS